jgi:uncharacterized membrane protein
MRTRNLRSAVYLGGGLGLLAALFAAAEVYDSALTKICSFGSKVSCGAVATSGKTFTLGVPDWAWGVAGFVVILVLAGLAEQRSKDSRIAYLLLAVTTAGVALAVYLLYVEAVEIGAICPVCVSAYLFGFVAWAGAVGLARKAYRRDHREPEKATPAT